MLTVPDGSAEAFKNVSWVACNLEYEASRWDSVRNRAANMGIEVFPWIRLANDKDTVFQFEQHIRHLVNIGRIWKSKWILPNYEKEAERFAPSLARSILNDTDWEGLTGWSTLGWLLNDVDYSPICNDPALLQIFPEDMKFPPEMVDEKVSDCVYNARVNHGFTYVGVTYQSYRSSHTWFDCDITHSVFTGNTIPASDWDLWFP